MDNRVIIVTGNNAISYMDIRVIIVRGNSKRKANKKRGNYYVFVGFLRNVRGLFEFIKWKKNNNCNGECLVH